MVALSHNALRHKTPNIVFPPPVVDSRRPNLAPVPGRRRVAVVVNGRARAVGDETLRWLRAAVAHEDLFITTGLGDLPAVAEMLFARRYDAVLWAGGDGTFVRGVGALLEVARARHLALPEVGVLRLGTGNAVAETFGAAECSSEGLMLDVSRARAHATRRELALLDVEGQPSVFCGFGLDAMIQADYEGVVKGLRRAGLADHLDSAAARYFLSVAGRTIPRFLMTSRPEIVAINRGAPAIKIDVDGHQVGAPIPAGRVLWRGSASLVAASTVPYYGLGLKMFPHVQRRLDRFQLRLTDISAAEVLTNLRKVWRGTYAGPSVHDFLVDEVELVLARPAPFQAGGDLLGDRGQVTVGLMPTRLKML